jgi:dTDP-4-amino-4,6-dideoxygalactose transaminase
MPSRTAEDLALLGGTPAFAEPLHVGRPNVGDRAALLDRIGGALDRRWLTNGGPLVEEFERRVADLVGVEHCVAVSSATIGLQLAARALGMTGEVIVPSFTFVGTAHALSWIDVEPVFAEVGRASHTLDPAAVAAAVGPRTGGIMGVHVWGRPCDVEALAAVAAQHDVPLLFDAAHALGCTHGGTPVGGFGDAEVFSFHATKVASTGEGGAITTNDAGVAERCRLMRNFGFVFYDRVDALGTNAKLSELAGAMGLTSLDALDDFVAANRRNLERYERGLADVPGLRLIAYDPDERHNFHYVIAEVEDGPLRRDDLVTALHAENVLARRYFHPGCHRLPPYREAQHHLPVTEDLCDRVVALPTGTAVDAADVDTVCELVRLIAENADAVSARARSLP